MWLTWLRSWSRLLHKPWPGFGKEKVRSELITELENVSRHCWLLLTTSVSSAQSVENRHYGKTKMNQRSSRSHTIFRMVSITATYGTCRTMGECGLLIIMFSLDPRKQRKERPSIRWKRWWSHYCVSFGKLVPFFFVLLIFVLVLCCKNNEVISDFASCYRI